MRSSKFLLTTFILLISVMCNECISQKTNPVHFGSKKAFNFCTLSMKGDEHSKNITGYAFGFFGKFPVARRVALQPELYYTKKGGEVTYDGMPVGGRVVFNLNYIEVPLLVVLHITDHLQVHMGPYASMLISSKINNASDSNSFDFENTLGADAFKKTEAGLAAGAGYDIGRFGFGTGYYHGLTNVGEKIALSPTNERIPDASNRVINIFMTFTIK